MQGTTSAFASSCHATRIPKTTDIVFVEYAINDGSSGREHFAVNVNRRTMERLLRRLMRYPHAPAVIILNTWKWWYAGAGRGGAGRGGAGRRRVPLVSVCVPRSRLKGVKGVSALHHMAWHGCPFSAACVAVLCYGLQATRGRHATSTGGTR